MTFLYAVGFVAGLVVPKTIDSGAVQPIAEAVIVNLLLLSVFAVQHSVMARRGFKQWWTQFVPKTIERSTYVLLASLALILVFWHWRPMPAIVWQVSDPPLAIALTGLSFAGWFIVSVQLILDQPFRAVRRAQVVANMTGQPMPAQQFRTPLYYTLVRHPLYLGFIIAFWAAPTMTVGHLLFAAVTTAYIFVGILWRSAT